MRITQAELGLTMARRDARFLGVFEHLYDDNALDVPNVSTHYVVLGYEFAIGSADIALPEAQHGAYRWLSERDLMHDPHVHANTRAYFER